MDVSLHVCAHLILSWRLPLWLGSPEPPSSLENLGVPPGRENQLCQRVLAAYCLLPPWPGFSSRGAGLRPGWVGQEGTVLCFHPNVLSAVRGDYGGAGGRPLPSSSQRSSSCSLPSQLASSGWLFLPAGLVGGAWGSKPPWEGLVRWGLLWGRVLQTPREGPAWCGRRSMFQSQWGSPGVGPYCTLPFIWGDSVGVNPHHAPCDTKKTCLSWGRTM